MLTFNQYCDKAESFGSFGCEAGLQADRGDWLVFMTQSRDSDTLEESNFRSALRILGGESETVEIRRFGHWAVGWVEHLFVHPSRAAEVQSIECGLADYPVVDDSDFSELELEHAEQAWESWGCRAFAQRIADECDAPHVAELLASNPWATIAAFDVEKGGCLDYEAGEYLLRGYRWRDMSREAIASAVRWVRSNKDKVRT